MKIKPHQREGLLAKVRKKTIKDEDNSCFVISLKYLDREQGQTLAEWQGDGLLAQAMEVLAGYCHDTLQNQCRTVRFKHYGDFPPREKTDFAYPRHVPEDAEWASLHPLCQYK